MIRRLTGSWYGLDLGEKYGDARINLVTVPGLRMVDSAKRVEGSFDAVAAAAFRLGIDVPVPGVSGFTRNYADALRAYQNVGVGWLVNTLCREGGALLADDMGLGKTAQAIFATRELTKNGGRILVICPAFLRTNWIAELTKWGETNAVSLGPKLNKATKAAWDLAPKSKWVVTSYDMANRVLPIAFKNQTPRALVMDEAHYLKGRTNARADTLQSIAALTTYKLAITGTPQWSRPKDLYQLLRLLFGQRFGKPFDFDLAYCGGSINQWGGLDNKGATRTDELKKRVNCYMLRRLKTDVAQDLPELSRHVVWVESEPAATVAFHTALASQGRGDTYRALEATLKAKMEPAMNLAKQAGRFLLFTWLKEHAAEMWRILNEDMDTPCELVTGDITADKRGALLERARLRGCGVVATLDSMGAGVNAQSVASTGIFHALDYTPAKLAQAEARIHRIGQTRGVTWTYLAMKESYDELVVRTVIDKLDQQHAVMGDGKEMMDSFGDSTSPDVEAACLRELYESL